MLVQRQVLNVPTHAGVQGAGAVDQLARPTASLVRTLLSHGEPPVILICPATSSFAHGLDVPIPTAPVPTVPIFVPNITFPMLSSLLAVPYHTLGAVSRQINIFPLHAVSPPPA